MSAPITAERLAEIEARANAATMWAPDECDLQVDPDDGYVYAPQGATLGHTLITLGDTYEDSGADWSFVAHARTDVPALVAEVRRLAAALEIARREGAEAMRERCDDAITARLVEAVREVREKTYRGTGAEKDIATAVWEAIDAMRDTVRALPLDAPGSES